MNIPPPTENWETHTLHETEDILILLIRKQKNRSTKPNHDQVTLLINLMDELQIPPQQGRATTERTLRKHNPQITFSTLNLNEAIRTRRKISQT